MLGAGVEGRRAEVEISVSLASRPRSRSRPASSARSAKTVPRRCVGISLILTVISHRMIGSRYGQGQGCRACKEGQVNVGRPTSFSPSLHGLAVYSWCMPSSTRFHPMHMLSCSIASLNHAQMPTIMRSTGGYTEQTKRAPAQSFVRS
jgi:hypothetical protein